MNARRDITELELLALVEGAGSDDGALTAERREALLADSTVARLVARLVADRAALTSLASTEPAPAGLVSGAIERAQREALAALAAAESASTGTPQLRTSSVVVERPDVLARLVRSAWPRRFAAAAGLALAVLGIYFAAAALIDWNATQPGPPIVVNPPRPADHPSGPLPLPPAPTEVALVPEAGTGATPTLTVPTGPIDAATAVSLAPRGHVVLVVRASDPQKAFTVVAAAAQRRAGTSLWQPLAADAPEFTAAINAARAGGFDFAGAGVSPRVALVSLSATTAAFDNVLAALRTDTAADVAPQWAGVDVTALNAARERAALMALQPHRVLWWEQGSTAWTPQVIVPVVILPR
jgi:hypothetical protein